MSLESLQTVRALIDAWNSGDRDFERLGAYFAPTVSLESPLSSVSGEPYRGQAGLEQWARDLDEQFERWEIVPEDVRAVGDQVLAVATVNAVGRASAAALRFPAATVFTFESDQRLARIRIYLQVHEAFEAVGLALEDRPGRGR
jgi:ketosteroid isomerase-like protein